MYNMVFCKRSGHFFYIWRYKSVGRYWYQYDVNVVHLLNFENEVKRKRKKENYMKIKQKQNARPEFVRNLADLANPIISRDKTERKEELESPSTNSVSRPVFRLKGGDHWGQITLPESDQKRNLPMYISGLFTILIPAEKKKHGLVFNVHMEILSAYL